MIPVCFGCQTGLLVLYLDVLFQIMQSFKILVASKAESEDGIGCIVKVEATGKSEEVSSVV